MPTQLTPAVPRHRKPARRFQVIGVFILVAGAVIGSWTALHHDPQPNRQGPVLADDAGDPAGADEAMWRSYADDKAKQAAKADAERAKAANEVAAQEAAARQATPKPDVPASCDAYTGNRALGCAILLEVGFGLDQMPCLDKMWTKESNWRTSSHNASSGAHGIPQALPASKMAPYGADYLTNPVPQIRWGLDYIKNRYQTPCKAWSFWQAHSWY
ncbi:MAG TPA: lytic transglycosylase domain-containing protein [Micromonosporaceae bacterium]